MVHFSVWIACLNSFLLILSQVAGVTLCWQKSILSSLQETQAAPVLEWNHGSLAFVAPCGSGSPGYSQSLASEVSFSPGVGPEEYHPLLWPNTAVEGQNDLKSRGNTSVLGESQKELWQGPAFMPHYIPVCMPGVPGHIDRQRRRGSGMLPEIIFTGENIDFDFNANILVWSLPHKNSLSTWTIYPTSSQWVCMQTRTLRGSLVPWTYLRTCTLTAE